ncbi:MAG TPA: EAL domain-containing protein [Hyphomicrobiaceae bacterium]|nr:EAL domain-containing protein [Hyphomicrobiaceae bacterium]
MYRVLTCLAVQHDYRLVLLAVMVCVATSCTAFSIYSRAAECRALSRLGWLFLAGGCAACGIWATHFVAMLAYKTGLPTGYDPVLTAGSLLIAFVATTLGFMICAQGPRIEAGIGGAVIGVGIALMHFIGMWALIVPGVVEWDPWLATVAVACATVLAAAASLAFHVQHGLRAIALGGALLAAAICSLHFIAMAAVRIVPDPTVVVQAASTDPSVLALAIAGLTLLVMLGGLTAAWIDHQSSLAAIAGVRELVDAASEGVVIANDGVIVNVNRRILELSGRPLDALVGSHVAGDLLEGWQPVSPKEGSLTTESVLKAAHGARIAVEVMCRPFASGSRGNEVYTLRDLTEQRRNEARIAHMAHHDALTDLPNRVFMRRRMEQALADVSEHSPLAVLCLDLDRFKLVNDTLGHPVGDALLQAVADRLRACVRQCDTAARLGGDEFAVLQVGASQPFGAKALATRLIDAISAPYVINEHQVLIGVSVGVALAPRDAVDPNLLFMQADMALYRAKAEGRGVYCFFEREMDERMQARRALEMDLRAAVINGEFELYYQPIINVDRNEPSGFEALLRWRHPQRGIIQPSEFMPVAEETGFMIPVGEWVLQEACEQAAKWPEHFKVAINLSPAQLRATTLLPAVFNAIAMSGIAPSRVELEITEAALLEQTESVLKTLRQLQNVGIKIALDDFGAGRSSLGHLRRFPFNKIKIDRSFVSSLSVDGDVGLAIVRAVAQMGTSLGMVMTAEGVETEEQLKSVRAEGCTEVQGFIFGPPRPAEDLEELFFTHALRSAEQAVCAA